MEKEHRKEFEDEEWISLAWLQQCSYEEFIDELHK